MQNETPITPHGEAPPPKKALVLAAGFGTRLRPFTHRLPKPLFPFGGKTLLDRVIAKLIAAGFQEVVINTHHLHEKIASHIANHAYEIPVHVRFEPTILGTGGAIRNTSDFWQDDPFLVINSDIVTDIDLASVYAFHGTHTDPITLVLYDDSEFNTVNMHADGLITGFSAKPASLAVKGARQLTFTGIQVLDPKILTFIPNGGYFSIIDAYRYVIQSGLQIRGWVPRKCYWSDVGTPDRYCRALIRHFALGVFTRLNQPAVGSDLHITPLTGDGSDRKWYRLNNGESSLIVADHGIQNALPWNEADAMVAIGRHLEKCGVRVPSILDYNRFSGLVFVEDLGDQDLQQVVLASPQSRAIEDLYNDVINQLVLLGIKGAENFDTAWTFQSTHYDADLIREREARYFTEAFLQGYLKMPVAFETLAPEFEWLASQTMRYSVAGFIHRDIQARNIMLRNKQSWFIDFQGGRLGPLQYDLASLLLDPYVGLPEHLQNRLLDYALDAFCEQRPIDADRFRNGFLFCKVTRNLQILGAFAFLSQVRGKRAFETHIPAAMATLTATLQSLPAHRLVKLRVEVREATARLAELEELNPE